MARNIALFGAREVQDKRRFVTGVTASLPIYREVDAGGSKEFVVDVYLGPDAVPSTTAANVVKDVPIPPYAKNLVTAIGQPVTLERSREGIYTVTGRAKVLAAGALAADGDIMDPTYHLVRHNLADLRVRHVADLDYTLEPLQATPSTKLRASSQEPLQVVRANDAFGNQVLGPEVDEDDVPALTIAPALRTTSRFVRFQPAKLGPRGNALAMSWGSGILQPTFHVVIEINS